jgi:3-oxoisoapionate decarboxylase
MKLGINTYTFMWSIGFPGSKPQVPLTALGLLEKTRSLGVSVVQIGPNLPFHELSEAELVAFIEQAQAWGIELEMGTRGLEWEKLEPWIALCKRTGSRLLRTVPEVGGKMPTEQELVGCLGEIVPLLERADLLLGLENGSLPAEVLRKAIEATGSRRVGVVLDMVNSLAVPEGWKEVTRTLAPYTMCLHYKDFQVQRVWHMMGFTCEGRPAGQGQIDTGWLFEELKSSRYDFNVILELWPPQQNTLDETIALEQRWAKESIEYLRRFVSE